MTQITTIFFDIGGVILTNGWDRRSRRATIERFELDWEEFTDRHDFVAHDFETGRIDLTEYLRRTVFYRPRPFTQDAFFEAMKAHSAAIEGSLDIVSDLVADGVLLATLNNESRELNEHRIDSFGLRRLFRIFLRSCYLGVKKPEAPIYRLAFHITQRRPEECLFVDDRSLNLECALDEGLAGIRFDSPAGLRAALAERGLLSRSQQA